jgi:hypothetical protein
MITAGEQTFGATINDSQVSRDFPARLPATLPWERNAGIEYSTELGAPLTGTGPFYTDVEAGDIVYYNPMDSITIIYSPTSSVPTLTTVPTLTKRGESPPTSPPSRTRTRPPRHATCIHVQAMIQAGAAFSAWWPPTGLSRQRWSWSRAPGRWE